MRRFIVALVSMAALEAHAIPISTSAGEFEVTTVEGTFDGVSTVLMSQAWWGDAALANELALLVGSRLGGSGPNLLGPRFAVCIGIDCLWDATDVLTVQGIAWVGLTNQLTQFAQNPAPLLASTWAVAERIAVPVPVPEPGTSMLLLVGLLGSTLASVMRKGRAAATGR